MNENKHNIDPINYNKKGKERGGLGKFLAKIKHKVAPSVLDAVGVGDFSRAIGIVSNDQNNAGLNKDEAQELFRLIELEIKDRAGARLMQIQALKQEDLFSKRFIYYLAIFWSIIGAVYIFMATFTKIINESISNTVIGFLLGTIVSSIITFFFGSSQGSKDKNDIIKSINNGK